MMSMLTIIENAAAFFGVIGVLVLVHEFGHYVAARANGVQVEVFSIGLGPELCGFTDRGGTHWRLGGVPIGGYVKMFGQGEPGTGPGSNPAGQTGSFQHKRLGQQAVIVAAGPFANFLFAITIFAILLKLFGHPPAQPFASVLDEVAALFGRSAAMTWDLSLGTVRTIGQFLIGAHGPGELIGPLRAAEVSGAVSRDGLALLGTWMAIFSVNLGVTNLFPIPSLDGGHLVFCAAEAIQGRPVNRQVRRNSARVGLALIFGIMAFATMNDLVQISGLNH
jgi:membrane-associated protease RseP (regulator of RpoE activity)